MTFDNVCAKCGSPELRKSAVRGLSDWLVSWLLQPYRCRLCDYRQLKFRGMEVRSPLHRHSS